MPVGTEYVKFSGDGPVPQDYTVAGAQTFDLQGVKADFDGSGAGGSFVPVVQILSPAGQVMAQAVGSVILAGGSATVTFAPFLKSATVAGSSYTPPTTRGNLRDLSFSVPNGTLYVASLSYLNGTNLFNLAVPQQPTFVTAGNYAVQYRIEVTPDIPADTLVILGAATGEGTSGGIQNDVNRVFAPGITCTYSEQILQSGYCRAGSYIQCYFINQSGITLTGTITVSASRFT